MRSILIALAAKELTRPAVNFTLHCSDKINTPPEIFKHRFYELCHDFKNYCRIFTDGSKEGNRVAAAVVHRDNTKCVRLPDTASIFSSVSNLPVTLPMLPLPVIYR